MTLEKFKEYHANVAGESGCNIGILRTDNGAEFVSHDFKRYLIENKIHHQNTVPYNCKECSLPIYDCISRIAFIQLS